MRAMHLRDMMKNKSLLCSMVNADRFLEKIICQMYLRCFRHFCIKAWEEEILEVLCPMLSYKLKRKEAC